MKSYPIQISGRSSHSHGFYEQSTVDYSVGLSARSHKQIRFNETPIIHDLAKILPIALAQPEKDELLGSDILKTLGFSFSQVRNVDLTKLRFF